MSKAVLAKHQGVNAFSEDFDGKAGKPLSEVSPLPTAMVMTDFLNHRRVYVRLKRWVGWRIVADDEGCTLVDPSITTPT